MHQSVTHYGVANILADSVSRLKAVGLYHDLDLQNSQLELGRLLDPLSPTEQTIYTPIIVHRVFVKPDVETLEKSLQSHK